ncbi:MAG: hypothetical protein LQ337_003053 [Flavoplaca oasis]|nr:MAG: hypothetical protein LQ337_003053 [Flavoplaca oasis]
MDPACQIARDSLSATDMIRVTDTVEALTVELHQSTISTAEALINIPALLDTKTEQTVEKLMKEMATMLIMLEQEQIDIENGLQSTSFGDKDSHPCRYDSSCIITDNT